MVNRGQNRKCVTGAYDSDFFHLPVSFKSNLGIPLESSDQVRRRSWSGSKPFGTLIVFMKEFFEKVNFEKSQQTTTET